MRAAERRRAVAAAMSIPPAYGLAAEDALVLNDSNRLVLHLTPSDLVARVAPAAHPFSVEREVELARHLADTGAPIAPLDRRIDPQVFVRDGLRISWWEYLRPRPERALPPVEYLGALVDLHAGLAQLDLAAPRFTERLAAVQEDVARRDLTPDLAEPDRALLVDRLSELTGAILDRVGPEQLLHGEPHRGNILDTAGGVLFCDFENTAYGPLEYDLAWAPAHLADSYPGTDTELLEACRGVVLAVIAAYRWRRDDEHPSGRPGGIAFLRALRDGPPWRPDAVTW